MEQGCSPKTMNDLSRRIDPLHPEAARKDIVRGIERRKIREAKYWNFDEVRSTCDLNSEERRMSPSRDRMGGVGEHGLAWVGYNLV